MIYNELSWFLSLFLEFPAVSLSGGLLFAWRPGVDFDAVQMDQYCISLFMYSDPPTFPWAFNFVHCSSEWETKEEFWENISALGSPFDGP